MNSSIHWLINNLVKPKKDKTVLSDFEKWLEGTLLACEAVLAIAKAENDFRQATDYQIRILVYRSVKRKIEELKDSY